MDHSVIPECYVDTNLIETLVPPQRQYNHQKGCGTVAKIMKERFHDRFALGIIDRDKTEIDYLKEFREVCSSGSLILHKHLTRHHYIIQISPAIERFIISNAVRAGINLNDFGLPSDFELLKRESKKINSKNDQRFKRLFRSLIQNGAPDLLKLALWVDYLKSHNYHTDLEALQRM
jgi:hypothetical protein